jgi:transposase
LREHVFVNVEWLEAQFRQGLSLEAIARLAGCHASTVGYWARKHGLRPPGAHRFAARGAPDRELLEELAAEGASLAEMATAVDRSVGAVRHWLRKWGIERRGRQSRRPAGDGPPPETAEMICRRHGRAVFRLEGRGYYRCTRCRMERVSEWRRRTKRRLIAEAGGACILCGYDRCAGALHFHHLDPQTKSLALSREGVTRSLAEARAEAAKCVLLCANCHAEVEADIAQLPTGATPLPSRPAAA